MHATHLKRYLNPYIGHPLSVPQLWVGNGLIEPPPLFYLVLKYSSFFLFVLVTKIKCVILSFPNFKLCLCVCSAFY